MKGFVRLASLIVVLSMLAACAQTTATPVTVDQPAATNPPVATEVTAAKTEAPAANTEAALTPQEEWLKANQLGKYDTGTQDWAAIEAAAKTEGKLLVYANSSKIEKAAEKFMEQYPEIKVEGFDLGGDDVLLKTVEEQKAGAFTGDVWFSGGGPDIKGELMPKQYLWRFVPDAYKEVIPAALTDPLMTARFGVRILAYNKEVNPDGCPVNNLWQLTDAEWKGKVHIEDPLNDASTLGILMTIATHADEMAAAYKELYGKDPVLDADTPDAGQLWLKRFAQNNPIPESGGDEVDSAFATPGMTDNLLGFTSYSNYPDVVDGALAFEPCWGAKPVMGVQTQTYVGIINQAPHPNAAKLWLRFILSEEGAAPWMKIGNYLPRTDIPAPEGAKALEEVSKITWTFDDGYVYNNIVQARDFYLLNLSQ